MPTTKVSIQIFKVTVYN